MELKYTTPEIKKIIRNEKDI